MPPAMRTTSAFATPSQDRYWVEIVSRSANYKHSNACNFSQVSQPYQRSHIVFHKYIYLPYIYIYIYNLHVYNILYE